MANIVLAHGLLGFGSILPDQPLDYFNGIKALYESYGHKVLCPSVAPLGPLKIRARELEQQIVARWKDDDEPIFMLAHSMGGLDCRRVIASIAGPKGPFEGRFPRLITVSTPHFGSPVASTVLDPVPFLRSPLQWVTDRFAENTGALADLRSRRTLQDPSVPGVDYLCIGCDASQALTQSVVFTKAALIGDFSKTPNDGVVSLASASNTNNASGLWAQWPVDHGAAVGWPSGGIGYELAEAAKAPPAEHLERYRLLLPHLIAG